MLGQTVHFKSPEAKKPSGYFSHSKKDPLLFLQRQKTLDVEKPSAVVNFPTAE